MERTAKAVIERSRYEDKYGVEVTQDEVTGQTSVRDREKDEVELAKEQARSSLIELDLGRCWHIFFLCMNRAAAPISSEHLGVSFERYLLRIVRM